MRQDCCSRCTKKNLINFSGFFPFLFLETKQKVKLMEWVRLAWERRVFGRGESGKERKRLVRNQGNCWQQQRRRVGGGNVQLEDSHVSLSFCCCWEMAALPFGLLSIFFGYAKLFLGKLHSILTCYFGNETNINK